MYVAELVNHTAAHPRDGYAVFVKDNVAHKMTSLKGWNERGVVGERFRDLPGF
jgi:hypothetical protein